MYCCTEYVVEVRAGFEVKVASTNVLQGTLLRAYRGAQSEPSGLPMGANGSDRAATDVHLVAAQHQPTAPSRLRETVSHH